MNSGFRHCVTAWMAQRFPGGDRGRLESQGVGWAQLEAVSYSGSSVESEYSMLKSHSISFWPWDYLVDWGSWKEQHPTEIGGKGEPPYIICLFCQLEAVYHLYKQLKKIFQGRHIGIGWGANNNEIFKGSKRPPPPHLVLNPSYEVP